jgi:hypothetical protein
MKVENWISIKENGLPKEGRFFLVYCPQSFPKNYRGVVAEFYVDGNFKMFYDEAFENPIEDATHYIPLPEAPK